MTLENQCKQLAKTMGVEVEHNYDSYERCYEIQVAAPDGKQWQDGQSIHLVAVYYTYDKGGKSEAFGGILNRMQQGFEDIDETINPQ